MTRPTDHQTQVLRARITGILYLVIIVLGLFSEVYVRGGTIVAGDPAATVRNIVGSELLFRLGIASDIVVFLADVAVAALLYVLLRPVGRTISLATAAFRLTGTAVYSANLLNQFAALFLATGEGPAAALGPGDTEALASFFMELQGHGYDLGLVFFGVHCLGLGYLLVRSNLFPGVLGALMGLAGLGYLAGSFTLFVFPELYGAITPVYVAPLVGEVAFCLWLIVKGVRLAAPTAAPPTR
jgi:hypothetical protein